MTIDINMPRPLKFVTEFFKYNKCFWVLHKIERDRLGYYDIDRRIYITYLIRHKLTNKIYPLDGWGTELTQENIYGVLGRYDKI